MIDWIDINERKPDQDQIVFVLLKDRKYHRIQEVRADIRENEYCCSESNYREYEISHWALINYPVSIIPKDIIVCPHCKEQITAVQLLQ